MCKDVSFLSSEEYQVAMYLEDNGIDRACATFERANPIMCYTNGRVCVRTVASMSSMEVARWLNYEGYFEDAVTPEFPVEHKTAYIVSEYEMDSFDEFMTLHEDELSLSDKIGRYNIFVSDYDWAWK